MNKADSFCLLAANRDETGKAGKLAGKFFSLSRIKRFEFFLAPFLVIMRSNRLVFSKFY